MIGSNIRSMIPRIQVKLIEDSLNSIKKIHIIYGPRQAGKTTVLKSIAEKLIQEDQKPLFLNCDLKEHISVINTTSITDLTKLLKDNTHILIDEAQRLDNPGLTLKIIYDEFPTIKVLATGSSSFKLKNQLSDALTGRYVDFNLYPLSFQEIINETNTPSMILKQSANQLLTPILLYGLYPGVYTEKTSDLKQKFLEKIIESYLFNDILSFHKIKYSDVLLNLTRALAYQIGSEVNENELSKRLKVDRKTVVKYLDLLEQTFVIIKVYPFSKNPRREIGRNYKVYFIDLGLRNALIGDFHPLEVRQDLGSLWENFIAIERIKKSANENASLKYNFWRTFSGAEVDWIENKINIETQAFEFKYGSNSVSKGAKNFELKYKTNVTLINQDNFLDWI